MHRLFKLTALLLAIKICASSQAFAIESRSNREDVVSPRYKRFYKSNSSRQYLSFGGIHSSDYNSKSYQLTSRYLYQSQNFIHEINFKNQHSYSDKGSGSSKKYNVKTSELYDFSIASKARIGQSKNYGVLFHRTIYDKFDTYQYDVRNAIGIGRMFFKERIELDVSLGYHDVQNQNSEIDVISSIRTNFKLGKNLTLIQRGYWFFDHYSFDNELKNSLVYRLGDKLSFELRHNFEQRRYNGKSSNNVTNQLSRSLTVGLIFDLN
jgi:hypothetical protein